MLELSGCDALNGHVKVLGTPNTERELEDEQIQPGAIMTMANIIGTDAARSEVSTPRANTVMRA